jgi:hypothetical protein
MGGKPSHAIPSNRPESGGSNKDDVKEKSGLLEREKQQFAASEQAKQAGSEREDAAKTADRVTGDKGELQGSAEG